MKILKRFSKMSSKILIEKFESLTINDKKEALDFIDFLRNKDPRSRKRRRVGTSKIEDEKFIGMWENRDDMTDSAAWVRNLRRKDWA